MQHTVHTFDLPSGPKLLVVQVPNAVKALFEVYIRAGRRYVGVEKNEIAHLTEHLLFESNAHYANTFDFMLDLEKDGIGKNGSTGKNFLNYYMIGGLDKAEKMLELLLVQLSQPLFLETDIISQKAVIRNELARGLENDKTRVSYRFGQIITPEHYIGTKERIASLNGITKKDIQDYYTEYYTRKNLRFLAAGDFSDQDVAMIQKKIEKLAGTMPLGEEKSFITPKFGEYIQNIDIRESIQKNQVFFKFGHVFSDITEEEDDALGFYLTLLFSGLGSRIHQKSRKEGLSYSTGSFFDSLNCDYNDLGFFDQTKPENAVQLFELIIHEMADIRDGNFSTDEFERAKGLVYNRVKTRFQLPGDYLSWYVDEYLYDKPFLDIQKTLDTIQNFPRERISQVAKKFIKNDNWSLTIRGVEINAEDYRNIVMKYL